MPHARPPQLRARNLQPVLQWAEAHRAQLSPDGGPAAFEFGLHALAFIELLTGGGGGGGCGNGGGGGSSGAAGLASSGDEDMEDGEAGGSFGRGDAAAALAYAKAHFPAFQARGRAEGVWGGLGGAWGLEKRSVRCAGGRAPHPSKWQARPLAGTAPQAKQATSHSGKPPSGGRRAHGLRHKTPCPKALPPKPQTPPT
jgi:hypothetical protein